MIPIGEEALAAANGIEIAYQEIGDPEAAPLLLVMGLGSQIIHWPDDFCRLLAEGGRRVIRFDNRDIGHSTKLLDARAPGPEMFVGGGVPAYLLADMAADAVGLLDHLGIDVTDVVGVSMGGMISQTIAIEQPHRVRSLGSIMSTTGNPAVGQPTPAAVAALMTPPLPTPEGYAEATVQTIGSPAYPIDEGYLRDLGRRSFERSHYPEGVARQLHAIACSPDRTEALRGLEMPTLVLHGREDPLITLSGGEATARAIPGARLRVIDGMGHNLPPQLWQEIGEEIGANLAAARPA